MKKYKEWLTNEIEIMESETSEYYPHEQMVEREVVLNLINQLDEPEVLSQELPVIPKYVADFIEEVKASGDRLDDAFSILRGIYHQSKTADWVAKENRNSETFARAWLDGCEVEKDPKYYAKLKEIRPLEGEWLTNLSSPKYYALDTKGLMLGEFLLDLVGMKTEASTYTLKDWERYGINDSNADFVEVEGMNAIKPDHYRLEDLDKAIYNLQRLREYEEVEKHES